MRKYFVLLSVLLTVVFPATGNVITNIYSGFTLTGGGTPYSGFVGTLNTPGISFATDTGYNWRPFGLSDFGADVLATLSIPVTGTYTFHLSSDDGALVFIDSVLLIDRGGPHAPSTTDGIVLLSAGVHNLEVQFFECCGGPSGLDFEIPTNVVISSTPEPGSLVLLASGLAAAFFFWRKRFC